MSWNIDTTFSQNTPIKIAAGAFLTWCFCALQCNSEYCYTTDNPIVKVTLSLGLASGVVMALSTQAVSAKIQQGVEYCRGNFFAKPKADTAHNMQPAALIAEALKQAQAQSEQKKIGSEENASDQSTKGGSKASASSLELIASTQPAHSSESNLNTPSSEANQDNPASPFNSRF